MTHFKILVLNEDPSLPKLLELRVPLLVSDKYHSFGIMLLDDKQGNKMAIIRNKCHGDPESITIEVLTRWLQGGGITVTWESLSVALRQCHSSSTDSLAHQLDMALSKL